MKIYWLADGSHKVKYHRKDTVTVFCNENNFFPIYKRHPHSHFCIGVFENEWDFDKEKRIYDFAKKFGIEKIKTSKRNVNVMAKEEILADIYLEIQKASHEKWERKGHLNFEIEDIRLGEMIEKANKKYHSNISKDDLTVKINSLSHSFGLDVNVYD